MLKWICIGVFLVQFGYALIQNFILSLLKSTHGLFGLVTLKKIDPVQNMLFNLDRFVDIDNAKCNSFLLIFILHMHVKIICLMQNIRQNILKN